MFNKDVHKITTSIHLMGLIARNVKKVCNAPEGIHQDGANYIVSALVIERKNVQGGTSVIYGPDKREILYSRELQEGEGIFQADMHSPLWHYVTPISKVDKDQPGHRYIIGLDFSVE